MPLDGAIDTRITADTTGAHIDRMPLVTIKQSRFIVGSPRPSLRNQEEI
jgi:hypothetical protein